MELLRVSIHITLATINIFFHGSKFYQVILLHSRIHIHAGYILTQWITDAERRLYKYIYLSLYCKGSKRVTQGLRVSGSWRSNITAIFWPQSYGRQRCVFLVLHGCSTAGPGPTLLNDNFLYCILSVSSLDPNSSGPQAPSAWCGFPYHISPTPTLLQLQFIRAQMAPSAWCGFPYHISSPTGCNSTAHWLVELNWVI